MVRRMSAYIVWCSRTHVLQEGHLTPYDHVTLSQYIHIEPFEILTIWPVLATIRPGNQLRKIQFRFGLVRFLKTDQNRSTRSENTTELLLNVGSQPCLWGTRQQDTFKFNFRFVPIFSPH